MATWLPWLSRGRPPRSPDCRSQHPVRKSFEAPFPVGGFRHLTIATMTTIKLRLLLLLQPLLLLLRLRLLLLLLLLLLTASPGGRVLARLAVWLHRLPDGVRTNGVFIEVP